MDLLLKTKELCRLYNIKPARSKGQNFLIREEIYDQIIAAADLQSNEIVLEVGPGLGFLTAKLAKEAGRVVALELDDKLAEVLRTGLLAQEAKNVEVINQNVLDIKIQPPLFPVNQETGYKIVANLPYNITSVFLRKFLSEAENKPKLTVLMLQKEVAQRICAQAGAMSLLAISVQLYAKPEIIKIVPKEDFWPQPEVDSAIVKITPHASYLFNKEVGEKDFFRLVKFGFVAKRKMLKNNLAAGFKINQNEAENKITKAGFDGKIRAQELSVDDWLKLFVEFRQNML
jgi:16S rRNA (adenine1518-N6/adenine1519-N6)-dimethyltransferase